jgi:hypothetical protein
LTSKGHSALISFSFNKIFGWFKSITPKAVIRMVFLQKQASLFFLGCWLYTSNDFKINWLHSPLINFNLTHLFNLVNNYKRFCMETVWHECGGICQTWNQNVVLAIPDSLFFRCHKLHVKCFQSWLFESTQRWLLSILTHLLLINNYKHFCMKLVWHKCRGICWDLN